MATIQNERDKLLQAAPVRFDPPPIDPSLIPGYQDALQDIDDLKTGLNNLGGEVNHLMNNSRDLRIYATTLTFTNTSGTTTPTSTTLTAVKGSGLTGTVSWAVVAGSATLSSSTGDSITVVGSTISGRSATIRARVTMNGANYDAYVTLTRLGAIAASNVVNLTNQVTGSLAAGNISGLGALAFLNVVNLNTQTTGALNGLTQVTNLGALAYANSVAANQIGAGTLAAGVIYAGNINANQITSGSFVGKSFSGGTFTGALFRTAASGRRIEISSSDNRITFVSPTGQESYIESSQSSGEGIRIVTPTGRLFKVESAAGGALSVSGGSGNIAGASFSSPGGGAPIRLAPQGSLPAGLAGSICFYNGWLCFHNGAAWYKTDGSLA